MPNRARSGGVSMPSRVVAPIEREPLDRHRDRLCLGPVRQPDLDLEVLHRRIEKLLDDRPESVDLVDEQDVALAQIGQRADQVTGLLERRAGFGVDVDAQFARDELGERGLAKSGRAKEQRVIERLPADERRLDVDAERVLDLGLPNELSEPLRSEREFHRPFFGQLIGRRDLVARHVSRASRSARRRGGSHGIEYMPNERRKGERPARTAQARLTPRNKRAREGSGAGPPVALK